MRRFLYFLYHTFIYQEKNRRDVIDYLRAIAVISISILIAWMVMYYGGNFLY